MAKCPICGGTGDTTNNIPPTNERWFCSLPTEEKAKEIYKIAKDDFKELRKLLYGVALWLKQPHNREE